MVVTLACLGIANPCALGGARAGRRGADRSSIREAGGWVSFAVRRHGC